MNLKLGILAIAGLLLQVNASGQDAFTKKTILEGNLTYFPTHGGSTYGIIMGCRKEILKNTRDWITLDAGIQEDIQYKSERYEEFGDNNGYVLKNTLNLTIGPSFHLLKSRKLILGMDIFGGWAFKKVYGQVDDEALDIHRSYSNSRNYFSRGIFIHSGYKFSGDWEIQAIFKTDLTALTNFDGIAEPPDYILGIGVRKSF